jgi:LmbE family N-acetylglucosaminyl deacetylase
MARIAKAKKKKQCIMTICAHNDDQILGAGGTIRKSVNNGMKAYTYVFSYGETSHPHLKPKVVAEIRRKESYEAAKILGEKLYYFGINEGKIATDFDPVILEKIILEKKPVKIFTHSPEDPHPDHKAVFQIVSHVLKKIKYTDDLYVFDVWNIFAFQNNKYPKLFVDISDTFGAKCSAFNVHKSQAATMITLGWNMYFKAILNGWNNHCKYAELFHKIALSYHD